MSAARHWHRMTCCAGATQLVAPYQKSYEDLATLRDKARGCGLELTVIERLLPHHKIVYAAAAAAAAAAPQCSCSAKA